MNAESAYSCLDLLRMTWLSERGQMMETFGTLLEISTSGAVLHIDEAVTPGTRITVHLEADRQVEGIVESFEHDEFGYYLSARMATEWHPSQYSPAFLLTDGIAGQVAESAEFTVAAGTLPHQGIPVRC